MRTITTTVYKFEELKDEVKSKVIENYYRDYDYPMLAEDLTELAKEKLTEKGIEFENLRLLYSLSYSQGDGLCFTGILCKDGKKLVLTHSHRYYFAKSVTMYFEGANGEEVEEDKELLNDYLEVCAYLEKIGYKILDYRPDFAEIADANEWEYTEDGELI